MVDMRKWEGGQQLKPEEEAEYLKDLCAYLREQQTLSSPTKNEDGMLTCEVVPDEVAAHAADIIEELWERVDKAYLEGINKGVEICKDALAYEAAKGKRSD